MFTFIKKDSKLLVFAFMPFIEQLKIIDCVNDNTNRLLSF